MVAQNSDEDADSPLGPAVGERALRSLVEEREGIDGSDRGQELLWNDAHGKRLLSTDIHTQKGSPG